MNYRKYPNPIDRYRVSHFTQAKVQRQDEEIAHVALALALLYIAAVAAIITGM